MTARQRNYEHLQLRQTRVLAFPSARQMTVREEVLDLGGLFLRIISRLLAVVERDVVALGRSDVDLCVSQSADPVCQSRLDAACLSWSPNLDSPLLKHLLSEVRQPPGNTRNGEKNDEEVDREAHSSLKSEDDAVSV